MSDVTTVSWYRTGMFYELSSDDFSVLPYALSLNTYDYRESRRCAHIRNLLPVLELDREDLVTSNFVSWPVLLLALIAAISTYRAIGMATRMQ